MNKKEELIITKDNYKGYSELYNLRIFGTTPSSEWTKLPYKMCVPFGVLIIYLFISTMIEITASITLPIKIMYSLLAVSGTYSLSATFDFFFRIYEHDKKKLEEIKEKYPYVDTKIKTSELQKGLEKVHIVTKQDNIEVFDVKQYEDYSLKAEQIKQDYFNETKYDKYVVNPPIEEAELEKVIQKVKKLGTR